MKFSSAQKVVIDFFADSKVRSTKTVWEKMKDGENWKWVLTLHNLNWGDALILYTKFILKVTPDKEDLAILQFSYLFDLNCKYHFVNFKDETDLKLKLQAIIFNNAFGDDIKNLSQFIENPTMSLNKELSNQKITDYTVFDIDYSPKISVVPCKVSSFDFKFDINNVHEIELNIKKEKENNYAFTFQFANKHTEVEVSDLSNIEGVIVNYIKSNIIE